MEKKGYELEPESIANSPFWAILRRLTEPAAEVRQASERRQARSLAAVLLVLVPVALLGVTVQVLVSPELIGAGLTLAPWALVIPVAYGLARSVRYRYGAYLTVAMGLGMTVQSVFLDPTNTALYAYFVLPVVLASAMLTLPEILFTATMCLLAGILTIAAQHEVLGERLMVALMVMVILLCLVVVSANLHRLAVEFDRRSELADREARNRALLEAAFGGLALVERGHILQASSGFARMFASTPAELEGMAVESLLPGIDPAVDLIGDRAEVWGRRRDGSSVPVHAVARGIDHGPLVLAVADLSEHKEMRARLHRADRMAVVGQLAAAVAHEINNPLTYVMGNLEQLSGPAAERALEGAQRIRRIVEDLSTFSHRREEGIVGLDLVDVARSAVSMARHELHHRAEVVERYGDVASIDGDPTRIGQVCLNLLVNAGQALPVGEDHRVTVTVDTDAEAWVRFTVEDDGPGIRPEAIERIFEPYYSTKEQGAGLGLAISKGIVEELGGRMFVESSVGEGTRIGFVVPPGRQPVVVGGEGAAPVAGPVRARILVIDDEPEICALLKVALEAHHVETAVTGPRGLDLALAEPWDLVLTDITMPRVTGVDIYKELARRAPGRQKKIVFLTGGAITPEFRRFIEEVGNPVLRKPFRLAALHTVVQRGLATSRTRAPRSGSEASP